ncbi:aminotransferase class IV family protein [Actinoplanes sp. CA-054009]
MIDKRLHAGPMAELDGRPATAAELQTLALTNYGHFTSFRVEDRKVRGLELHLERLRRDCETTFGVALDAGYLLKLIQQAAPRTGTSTMRVTVFDPQTDLGHPAAAVDPKILITQRPAPSSPLPAIRAKAMKFVRDSPEIKSVGLFGSLRQRRIAQSHGYDDALFTDADETISEGGTWNIGFFDGSNVIWPDAPCLEGVTMRLLQRAPHKIAPVKIGDIDRMEMAFATNAAIGVRAISAINNSVFPSSGRILDELRSQYAAVDPTNLQ